MGQVALAAKITHVPSMYLSELDGPQKGTRQAAIDALAELGQNAKPALDALVKALDTDNVRIRWHAARAVGAIGEDAIPVIPKLAELLLSDADPIVCKCLYAGNQTAYQNYRQMVFQQNLANEQQVTAMINQEASWDWGMWGWGGPQPWIW